MTPIPSPQSDTYHTCFTSFHAKRFGFLNLVPKPAALKPIRHPPPAPPSFAPKRQKREVDLAHRKAPSGTEGCT